MKDNDSVDELVISFLFPPSKDVAGMVLAKRHMLAGKRFDVIHADVKDNCDYEFSEHVDEYVNNRILTDSDCHSARLKTIFKCVDQSMEKLDKCDVYKKISTRVWKIPNNFLAFEYKLKHPEVYWEAEFSDPILYDTQNRKRGDMDRTKEIYDEDYLEKINNEIIKINKENNTNFELLNTPTSVYLLVEYLAYLFADNIIFTNKHQREVMLNQFPIDIKDFVLAKSEIKPHPILPKEYYFIKDYKVNLDSSKINIGYFGNIYSKRNFEAIFYAFETLNHKYKDKLAFHFYINDKKFFKKLTKDLEISKNIILNDTIDYLDFLNLTTKFDVLIINDLITSDCFEVNPYRPSKLSDYMGSGSDIWAMCEKGSTLDEETVRYKSYIDDYSSFSEILVEILNDKDYVDDDFYVDGMSHYFQKRLTSLNIGFDEEHKEFNKIKSKKENIDRRYSKLKKKNAKLDDEIKKLKKENEKLKAENEEILSSNSWKVTKSFRKVGGFIKK